MASWTDVPDSILEPGKPGRSVDIIAIRDNIMAAFEKAPGAPVLANDYIVEAMISAGAVSQSKLKQTTGTVTHTGTSQSSYVLPGGAYGFYPQVRRSAGSGSEAVSASIAAGVTSSTFTTWIALLASGPTVQAQAQQLYITASPPYAPYRDGDYVPLFVFALIDRTSGEVRGSYIAQDPPWANNGPTLLNPLGRIRYIARQRLGDDPTDEDLCTFLANMEDPKFRAEISAELRRPMSQEEKNRDMALIPHPFGGFDAERLQVVVIDPCDGPRCRALLARHLYLGDDIAEMLHGGYFEIDNTPIPGLTTPADVLAVSARCKLSR